MEAFAQHPGLDPFATGDHDVYCRECTDNLTDCGPTTRPCPHVTEPAYCTRCCECDECAADHDASHASYSTDLAGEAA